MTPTPSEDRHSFASESDPMPDEVSSAPSLSSDRVLKAALDLVDADGLDALTIAD